MPFQLVQASVTQSPLRLAITGPSGSGKTRTALEIAKVMAGPDGVVCVLDTENGSASKYAKLFRFMTGQLSVFSPNAYIEAISACEAAGATVIIVDSLSHAWSGPGGILEIVDQKAGGSASKTFTSGWRFASPQHQKLMDAIIRCKCHIICTMRSKMEYVLDGSNVPKKVGMEPVQRGDTIYEFDIVLDMDADHVGRVTKTRCDALDQAVIARPGQEIAETIQSWLSEADAIKPLPNRDELTVELRKLYRDERSTFGNNEYPMDANTLDQMSCGQIEAVIATIQQRMQAAQ